MLNRITYALAVLNRRTGWRLSRFNRWIYRATGGRLGDTVPGMHVVLLTTTGRRTGKAVTVPLASWFDGNDLIIGTFAGASPKDPQWFKNLCASPEATVQLKRDSFPIHARVLDRAQRDAFLRRVDSALADLYDRRSPRAIQLLRLTRT